MSNETAIALFIALLSTIVALVTLFIQLRTSKQQMLLQSELDKYSDLQKEKREFLYRQLEEFYDPIYSLLSINKSIFEKIGPSSSMRLDNNFPDEETSEVWEELSKAVINPNNLKICEYVETRLYLVSDTDDIKPYLEFITHAQAYKVFKEKPYEAYRLFQFPKDFSEHVGNQRSQLRKKLDGLMNERERT